MPPLTSVADAHVAVAVDGQRVEQLIARQPGEADRRCRTATAGASSPGDSIDRACNTRPVNVSAQYSVDPSGDKPMPFGASAG